MRSVGHGLVGHRSRQASTITLAAAALTAVSVAGGGLAHADGGTVAWQTEISGPGENIDAAQAVAIDAAGDVFAGGQIDNGAARRTDFSVVKADGVTGDVLWQAEVDGPGSSEGFGFERVLDIAVDPAGNAVAVGTLLSDDHADDFAVLKLDGETGEEMWRTVLQGTAVTTLRTDSAEAVVVDGDGDVYAGGFLSNEGVNKTWVVVKLDGPTGDVTWKRELNGTAVLFNTQVNALALDPQGHVIAAGSIVNAGAVEEFTVVKLDERNGNVVWRTELRGRADDDSQRQDEAHAVALDSAGDVLAAGFFFNDRTQFDMAVVKLDNAAGNVMWTRSLDGGADSFDIANAIAVDSSDDVLVGGIGTGRAAPRIDFSVAKLDGTDGNLVWRRDLVGGEARALTVDERDRVVVTGDLNEDLTVARFASATGKRVGELRLNGTDDSFDYGFDVAAVGGNKVVVVGSLSNRGASSDFTIVSARLLRR